MYFAYLGEFTSHIWIRFIISSPATFEPLFITKFLSDIWIT